LAAAAWCFANHSRRGLVERVSGGIRAQRPVTTTEAQSVALDPRFLESLDPAQVGAAASKLFAASVGDIIVALSRSPAHKHCSLADIEWMVLPPMAVEQFFVAKAAHEERGFGRAAF
jgi:hypothetical protein